MAVVKVHAVNVAPLIRSVRLEPIFIDGLGLSKPTKPNHAGDYGEPELAAMSRFLDPCGSVQSNFSGRQRQFLCHIDQLVHVKSPQIGFNSKTYRGAHQSKPVTRFRLNGCQAPASYYQCGFSAHPFTLLFSSHQVHTPRKPSDASAAKQRTTGCAMAGSETLITCTRLIWQA